MMLLRKYVAPAVVCAIVAPAGAAVISISTPFSGITRYDVTDTVPRTIHYQLVQIDTAAAGISFNLTPSNGAGSLDTTPATTLNYMAGLPAIGAAAPAIGINAGYFTPVGGATTNLISLEVSAGNQVSPWIGDGDTRSAGINISATNAVSFFTPASYTTANFATSPSLPLYNAVGSNYMSVKNNVKTGVGDDGSDFARTAVGVRNGFLFFFTIDNVGGSGSSGMTPLEVGALLHDTWGLTDVINFDGGGSTQMAMNSSRGLTYINTPAGASTRAVAASLVVYARPTTGTIVNTLDNFEAGAGHFVSSIFNASGSNINIGSASVASITGTEKHSGFDSMQLSISPTSTSWLMRDLSAAAVISQNLVMSTGGSIGYWLKTSIAGLTTAPAIHDGSALENGIYRSIIADNQWHLYQWIFTDAAQWDSFFNGNGQIDNVGVTLDSVLFRGTSAAATTVYLDDLTWTNSGTQAVPEPAGVGVVVIGMAMLRRRRRIGARV